MKLITILKKKVKIINGIKLFINDMFNVNFDETSVSYEYSDYLFDLMCKNGFIKNEKLFDIFFTIIIM